MNIRLSICAMAVGLVIGISSVACAVQYKMVDLGLCTWANDLNEKGQVVGGYRDLQNHIAHAFIWDDANGIRELRGLEGMNCSAAGINDNGQVVGWMDVQNERHMFLWDEKNGLNDLGTFGVQGIQPIGINNSGLIIGDYFNSNRLQVSFIWDQTNNQWRDVSSILGDNYVLCHVNDQGQFAGHMYGQNDEIVSFFWDGERNPQMVPSSENRDWFFCMNNSGEILVNNNDSKRNPHYNLWDTNSNTVTSIASLGCTMYALSLNDVGQFGGCLQDDEDYYRSNSAIWDSINGLQILQTPDCYDASQVMMINNSGLAVSDSYDFQGMIIEGTIIWVPQVPEPSGIVVLLGGVGGLAGIAMTRVRRN